MGNREFILIAFGSFFLLKCRRFPVIFQFIHFISTGHFRLLYQYNTRPPSLFKMVVGQGSRTLLGKLLYSKDEPQESGGNS